MFRNIRMTISEKSLQSYLGLLSHGNTLKIRERVIDESWFWFGSNLKADYITRKF